jgi:hypothetical protein
MGFKPGFCGNSQYHKEDNGYEVTLLKLHVQRYEYYTQSGPLFKNSNSSVGIVHSHISKAASHKDE